MAIIINEGTQTKVKAMKIEWKVVRFSPYRGINRNGARNYQEAWKDEHLRKYITRVNYHLTSEFFFKSGNTKCWQRIYSSRKELQLYVSTWMNLKIVTQKHNDEWTSWKRTHI